MGQYSIHQIQGELPPVSGTAARTMEHPPGYFAAYHPDRLQEFSFAPLKHWDGLARSAEATIRRFESQHGQLAYGIDWVLQRSESLGSSTIEGVDPSLRRVARAEAISRDGSDPYDDSAREVIGGIAATRLAIEIGDRSGSLDMDDLLAIHSELMRHTRKAQIAGRLREGWVRVGGVLGGYPPPAYVAPPIEHVPMLLDDLLDYINRTDHHPIIAAAVAHAQFEMIHPFGDGNGRTGRALVQTILRKGAITEHSTPPISALLALKRDEYVNALAAAAHEGPEGSVQRVHALDPWVTLFATTAEESCGHAEKLIGRIEAAAEGWESRIKARSKSGARKIMSCLPAMPMFSVQEIAANSGTSFTSAYRAVGRLEAAGIVASVRGKYRGRGLYEAPAILDIFQDGAPQGGLGLDIPALTPSFSDETAKSDKRAEAIRLRRQGYLHREIGNILGLSTSWAQQATKGVPRGPRRK